MRAESRLPASKGGTGSRRNEGIEGVMVMGKGRVGWTLFAVGVSALGAESLAMAQTPPRPAAGVEPQVSTVQEPVPNDLVRPQPGGLMADDVGRRAGETSYSA